MFSASETYCRISSLFLFLSELWLAGSTQLFWLKFLSKLTDSNWLLSAFDWTALLGTTASWTELHWLRCLYKMNRTPLNSTELHWTPLHWMELHWIPPHCLNLTDLDSLCRHRWLHIQPWDVMVLQSWMLLQHPLSWSHCSISNSFLEYGVKNFEP